MSKRKSFDVSLKLKAVVRAIRKSKMAAAREYGVDAKQIRVWFSQKEELVALKKKGKSRNKRLCGAGRKALDLDMEESIQLDQ